MVDVSQSKIARVESGQRELKTGFMRDLARVFRVPPSALLDVNPATPEGKKTARLLLAWDRLTDRQRDDVLKMVSSLAGPDENSNAS